MGSVREESTWVELFVNTARLAPFSEIGVVKLTPVKLGILNAMFAILKAVPCEKKAPLEPLTSVNLKRNRVPIQMNP